ncbi:MAG: cob(I)yrinic acid a,c-diamide adenosyltransferase [Parvibaculales bacterium]
MVKLNKIYTRSGDDGTTALADGARRPKHDARIACYGAVDEANAALGMARLHLSAQADLDALIGRLQNDLFDLGADLATPETDQFEALRISPKQVQRLEDEIDTLNADIPPLDSFILPGGSAAAAHLHLARTLIRRAERLLSAALEKGDSFSEPARQFINRASDLLFVAARAANQNGAQDVLWQPGANR